MIRVLAAAAVASAFTPAWSYVPPTSRAHLAAESGGTLYLPARTPLFYRYRSGARVDSGVLSVRFVRRVRIRQGVWRWTKQSFLWQVRPLPAGVACRAWRSADKSLQLAGNKVYWSSADDTAWRCATDRSGKTHVLLATDGGPLPDVALGIVVASGRDVGGDPPVALTWIGMTDMRNGYALQWHDTPPYRLLRTSDGGRTWRDLGVRIDRAPTVLAGRELWATAGTVVLHSTDAGMTWTRGAIHDAHEDGSFSPAVAGGAAYVLVDEGAAAGSNAVSLFGSHDAGLHWTKVAHTSITVNTAGALPFGCDKTGVSFVDARTGWVTGVCAGGLAYFYVTHDGGGHWHLQRLPGTGTAQCNVLPPRFFGHSVGLLEVMCFGTFWHGRLYRTDDGGRTWRPRPLPTAGVVSIADPDNLWMGTHHRLYVSHDGGASWQMLTVPFNISNYELDPVSAQTVFAAYVSFPPRASLRRSDDGGRTWRTAVSSRP